MKKYFYVTRKDFIISDGKISKESNFSHDPLNWQRCLHRLYQLIHDHLDQLVKNKLSSASSLSAEQQTIPPLLVTLAARLCHKVIIIESIVCT